MRRRISVTVDETLISWVDSEVEAKRFRSRSHALEFALHRLYESERMKGRD